MRYAPAGYARGNRQTTTSINLLIRGARPGNRIFRLPHECGIDVLCVRGFSSLLESEAKRPRFYCNGADLMVSLNLKEERDAPLADVISKIGAAFSCSMPILTIQKKKPAHKRG